MVETKRPDFCFFKKKPSVTSTNAYYRIFYNVSAIMFEHHSQLLWNAESKWREDKFTDQHKQEF